MNRIKQEAITLIKSIPDEREDVILKVVNGIHELVDDLQDEIYSRAEQDLAIMEEIESLTREEVSGAKKETT